MPPRRCKWNATFPHHSSGSYVWSLTITMCDKRDEMFVHGTQSTNAEPESYPQWQQDIIHLSQLRSLLFSSLILMHLFQLYGLICLLSVIFLRQRKQRGLSEMRQIYIAPGYLWTHHGEGLCNFGWQRRSYSSKLKWRVDPEKQDWILNTKFEGGNEVINLLPKKVMQNHTDLWAEGLPWEQCCGFHGDSIKALFPSFMWDWT